MWRNLDCRNVIAMACTPHAPQVCQRGAQLHLIKLVADAAGAAHLVEELPNGGAWLVDGGQAGVPLRSQAGQVAHDRQRSMRVQACAGPATSPHVLHQRGEALVRAGSKAIKMSWELRDSAAQLELACECWYNSDNPGCLHDAESPMQAILQPVSSAHRQTPLKLESRSYDGHLHADCSPSPLWLMLGPGIRSVPEVGSSRKMMDGCETRAHAILSRRCSPPDQACLMLHV